jgi:hypothetical protein
VQLCDFIVKKNSSVVTSTAEILQGVEISANDGQLACGKPVERVAQNLTTAFSCAGAGYKSASRPR